jgi:hypothetical protein
MCVCVSIVHGVDPTELSRAQNQLKSSVLMNLESRMILNEDLGRQVMIIIYLHHQPCHY